VDAPDSRELKKALGSSFPRLSRGTFLGARTPVILRTTIQQSQRADPGGAGGAAGLSPSQVGGRGGGEELCNLPAFVSDFMVLLLTNLAFAVGCHLLAG